VMGDQTVRAWGAGENGQLGDGTTTDWHMVQQEHGRVRPPPVTDGTACDDGNACTLIGETARAGPSGLTLRGENAPLAR